MTDDRGAQTVRQIVAFVGIVFLLLGVLFGAQIMTFIFGQLGPAQSGLTATDPGFNESIQVQNNSLNAIVTYTEQADTQLNTAAIAITLLILIALFLVFWVAFIRPMMQQSSGGASKGGNFA